MKLKYEFETVELDGEIMAVPVGDSADGLHAILRLNETASFILDCLREDVTEDEIVEKVKSEYEGDDATIREYVHGYLDDLRAQDILE